MGKAAMCIKMIEVLNSRDLVKVSELGEILDTNPRNVLEYKKELEEAGYFINTLAGRYGGYSLNKKQIFPSVKLSEEEKTYLLEGLNYLVARNDFLNKNGYNLAMGKVLSAIAHNEIESEITVINRFPLVMPFDELQKRYFSIKKALAGKNVLQVEYVSTKGKTKTHLLHPYKIFMYNNAWFMIAWNEKNGDIGYYKLNRINRIEILNKKFIPSKTFNENDYIDDFGMKKNGELYNIELKITGPNANLIRERIYGKNQEIIETDDQTTIIKVDMQDKNNILSFVMGFGSSCEVVEPKWLKEMVLNELKIIGSIYKK
jgi:predicted DNA-binding transcriptional regulator YafY